MALLACIMTSKEKEKRERHAMFTYLLVYLLTRQTDLLLDVLALFVMQFLHKNLQKIMFCSMV